MMDPILVASPTQFPGRCIDGSQGGAGEAVVDTHIEIDGVGRIYLSKRIVREAAWLYGMVERDELIRFEDRAIAAEAKVRELETDLADAQPILSAMHDAARRFGGDL